jgi:hypothetical protein
MTAALSMALVVVAMLAPAPGANASHPRPKGAFPVRASFVPAYQACAAPDRTHGPPLAFPSCSSPQQISTRLTVGSPPAAPVNMVGSWLIRVVAGVPGPPDDSGAPMQTSVTDVRCAAPSSGCGTPGADYTGELELRVGVRVSDHWNCSDPNLPCDGGIAATVQDIELSVPMSCAATADPALGATCSANMDLAFVYPGIAKDTKRMILEFAEVRVLDGGDDGSTSTADGAQTFLTQGVFIP